MTMDFSRLHAYSPPQWAPENTGYTYSLRKDSEKRTLTLSVEVVSVVSPGQLVIQHQPKEPVAAHNLNTPPSIWTDSSYSTAALEFEKKHKIGPVYESPKLSRRRLKLYTMRGLYGNRCLAENSQNHSISHRRNADSYKRFPRSRKQQSWFSSASETSMLSSLLGQFTVRNSCMGQSKSSDLSSSSENSAVSVTDDSAWKNGHTCTDYSILEREQTLTVHSVLPVSPSSSASHGDLAAVPFTCSAVRSVDQNHRHRRGFLTSGLTVCAGYSSAMFTALVSVMTLLFHCAFHVFHSAKQLKGFLTSGLTACAGYSSAMFMALVSVMTLLFHHAFHVVHSAKQLKGKVVVGAFWWLRTGWDQLISLINFVLTRCLPKLVKLLLCLLPFLLLFGLWCLGPSKVISYLPAAKLREWRTAVPSFSLALSLFSMPSLTSESRPAVSQPAAVIDMERVDQLEERLAALWKSVQQRDQKVDLQQDEALGLVNALQEQLNTLSDKDSLGLWVSQMLETKFDALRSEMERQASDRAQTQDRNIHQLKAHTDHLTRLELLLQDLAYKTEEIHQKQKETHCTTPLNVVQENHDVLLAEVQRLEAELGRIRNNLNGMMGCQGKCGQLDTLHETVSAKVREELCVVFYGSETCNRDMKLPDSLLQWLYTQYTNSSDLRAALAILELSLIRNVSLQLEQHKKQPCNETVTETVVSNNGTSAITEKQVQLIVQNALKQYSQDRTGLVDYALESGGGSILSTRCSETYETNTALMSLFGVPLWYLSQSPRVVIQPDVYPGNCWAFKGSQGYLVIRLSLRVTPTAFCLEHIPKVLAPTGNISSAPRHFRVYGLEDEFQGEGHLLGDYIYQEDGESLQTFPVMKNNDETFQIIEMRVLSNWGHPEYTCLYRFRVHGHPHFP